MKITQSRLKEIIKEEVTLALKKRSRPSAPGFGWGDIEEEYFEVRDDDGETRGRVEFDVSTKRWNAYDAEGNKLCYKTEKGWAFWKTKEEAVEAVLKGEEC